MQATKIDDQKANLLKLLKTAGVKGLNKSGLKINGSKLKKQALNELENESKIVNLEGRGRYLYVLKEFDNPLERACQKVEKILTSQGNKLLSKGQLTAQFNKGLPGKVKKELERAIDWLIKNRQLMKLKHGNAIFHLHVPTIISSFPSTDQHLTSLFKTPKTDMDRQKVLSAYMEITSRTGYSNIEIYRLQQALGVEMEILEPFLLNESKKGSAVLSFGDWSLSSKEIRSCSIDIDGTPHLLVRFKLQEEIL
ncbi:hypothetical protein SAMN02746065_106163 [Desulfocicer vacuolatum DSM 3385]|uniref:Uncharacterized protein n=1 Tax=Desulfocicer vacuolatum DSM 3385 TaxID=1121400 RepID=A0A1W2AZF8_9BACT|nr:hypothetical protein [Desulfocicer vacuolatum]SMC65841.1 hypothetical protein SAMN02746065_106163 [Desulfocicer vacuolatum DSM 3385]